MALFLLRAAKSNTDATYMLPWELIMPGSLQDVHTEKLPMILEPEPRYGIGLPALPVLSNLSALSALRWSTTANWLVPGHIMLGRYPGSEPKRPVDAATQRLRVVDLRIQGNVSTFVSLQKEVPRQDSATTWGFQGTVPYRRGFVPYYRDIVKSVPAAQPGQVKHFGIVDRQPAPSITALDNLIEDLAQRVSRGEVLYIHCWGGQGRTGLVAACLLGRLYPQLASEEALARVQAYFNLRGAPGPSPETDEQTHQVREWFSFRKNKFMGVLDSNSTREMHAKTSL